MCQPKIITISNIKIFIIYLPNFQRAPNNVQPCQNNTDQHCQNWVLYKESLLRLILRTPCELQIGMFERWYDIHTSKILCTFFHLSAKRSTFWFDLTRRFSNCIPTWLTFSYSADDVSTLKHRIFIKRRNEECFKYI